MQQKFVYAALLSFFCLTQSFTVELLNKDVRSAVQLNRCEFKESIKVCIVQRNDVLQFHQVEKGRPLESNEYQLFPNLVPCSRRCTKMYFSLPLLDHHKNLVFLLEDGLSVSQIKSDFDFTQLIGQGKYLRYFYDRLVRDSNSTTFAVYYGRSLSGASSADVYQSDIIDEQLVLNQRVYIQSGQLFWKKIVSVDFGEGNTQFDDLPEVYQLRTMPSSIKIKVGPSYSTNYVLLPEGLYEYDGEGVYTMLRPKSSYLKMVNNVDKHEIEKTLVFPQIPIVENDEDGYPSQRGQGHRSSRGHGYPSSH